MDEPPRTEAFQKEPDQEARLASLNGLLRPFEEDVVASFDAPCHPVVFLVGVPRSGTTLVAQALAATRAFAYPDNFVARFWEAPYLGMRIGQALGIGADEAAAFDSKMGATPGWAGPHEFGYFWRRWFAFGETHKVTAEGFEDVDVRRFRSELAAMESVRDRPLFFKNLTCGMNIAWLSRVLPTSRFVLITRDPLFNMQSILQARRSVHGDERTWFSLRPPQTRELMELDPYDQIAGQVHHTLGEVRHEGAQLGRGRFLTVAYESFCGDPRTSVAAIARLADLDQDEVQALSERVPERFPSSNVPRLTEPELERLREAYERVSSTV